MPAPRHAWILDAPRDLLLLAATPLLVVPLMFGLRATWSDATIAGFVLAFGATGHHLPGLLRAYGDRDLFERFRTRFVLGPVLLFIACAFFYVFSFQGLVAMITLWGTWHALAQVYGFGRIYDAKVGAFDPRAAQLDKALCIVWFVLPMLLSPWRLTNLFSDLYVSGLPVVSPQTLAAVETGWWAATGVITLLWLGNFVRQLVRGQPVNPVKALLFVSSIAFWNYAIASTSHAIVGLAMFEIFHDAQYLTIVWLYNRKRVDQPGASLSPALRFLFRPGVAVVPLYLAGVLLYGGSDFLRQRLDLGELTPLFAALYAMSGFLHYYYDSFIWNVRDRDTRAGLAVSDTQTQVDGGTAAGPWWPKLATWSLFAGPLALLVLGQVAWPRTALEASRAVVHSLPESAAAWVALGDAQVASAAREDALAAYRQATAIDPGYVDAWGALADLAREAGRTTLEREALGRIIALQPRDAVPLVHLAASLERSGDRAGAAEQLRRAQAIDPDVLEGGAGRPRRGSSPYLPAR